MDVWACGKEAPTVSVSVPTNESLENRNLLLVHSRRKQLEEDMALSDKIGAAVTFTSFVTEHLVCHPLQVIRRQCQVNHASKRYHLTPFSLIVPIYHLQQYQGIATLWKGLGSALLVQGISMGLEDLISVITPWPKEIHNHSSLKEFCQHILLKCVSVALATPFYAASFVETVQSDIASEKPAILDVFREGFNRLTNWSMNSRLLPIWVLILPTVALSISKYMFCMTTKGATTQILLTIKESPSGTAVQEIQQTASTVATLLSDVAFYPCETVVHRLYLQGTRTIIDNLDNGIAVLPILTNFCSPNDCYEACIAVEGRMGLYKGFGALILQHTMQLALISLSRVLFNNVGSAIYRSTGGNSNSQKPPINDKFQEDKISLPTDASFLIS